MQHGRLSGDATPATACLHVISTGALVPEGQSFTPYFETSFMCSTEQRRATDSVQLLQNVPRNRPRHAYHKSLRMLQRLGAAVLTLARDGKLRSR